MQDFLARIEPYWQPHEGQHEFLLADAKIKVLACGRRWGKTDACAIQLLQGLELPGNSKRLILAPAMAQSRLLFDRLLDLQEEISGQKLDKTQLRIGAYPELSLNGHKVMVRSGNQRIALRGLEADLIVIDEAAFVRESLVTDLASPMMATKNGTIILVSTPNGRNLFWQYFNFGQDRAHGIWSRSAPSWENPLVSEEFLAIQRAIVTERTYRVEYGAEFLDIEGAVFRSEALEACYVSEVKFKEGGRVRIGVDWGQKRDFTAVTVVQEQDEKLVVLEAQHFKDESWDRQLEYVAELVRRYPLAVVVCDGTATQSSITEFLQGKIPGFAVRNFVFRSSNKHDVVEKLAWTIEKGRLKFAPNQTLLQEFLHFRYKLSSSGHVKLEADGGHDDLVMSLAMACDTIGSNVGGIQLGGSR